MTVTLCIETSGPHCSLALADQARIYHRDRMLNRSHNEHLLPLMDELFTEAGLTARDVTQVAFGCGPGSFTGVRIAAAASQAVAEAANAQVVSVPSSLILAASAVSHVPDGARLVCSVPSRGQAYYLSSYALADDGAVEVLNDDELVESLPAWLAEHDSGPTSTVLVGAAPPWLPESWQPALLTDVFPSARALVKLAQVRFAQGDGRAPEHALPLYIAGDSPWRKQAKS